MSKLLLLSSLAVDFPPEFTATDIANIGAIIVKIWAFRKPSMLPKSIPDSPAINWVRAFGKLSIIVWNAFNSIEDNTNILVYCAGGYRSALAAKSLLDLGFKNVYNLGGFQEWVESGGEIQPNP